LGADHLDVALGLNNLATLHVSQGHYSQAAPLFRRSIAIRETQLGPDHGDVAKTLEEYAGLLRKTDQSADAVELEMRAKAIRAKLRS
ncbi:MAG TPA: tetratricopeptide repeat protein, partial [Nitrospiraceae bacterium]|nr:tetratricopeptide repeat protein [Nitrospiraceae bacterium]